MERSTVSQFPLQFVEEIDYNDIEKLEIVGQGSYGTVYKGKWRGTYVAVKHIDNEAERKTFITEIRQMSRVSHPNIVKLYGACTKNPVCLVMEYAEGGSLYKVLHTSPEPTYNAGHAISWVLQCAEGVDYLHNMKPKALIHRDLKPPNLLLERNGRLLKICDFGTACDLKTYMTNNKGSAAWMAPEVFEGSNYTEKCDVYSWGIILWQVLTRRKPFSEVGGNALRIMWSVHQGKRPPLIDGCPKPLEELMIRCWSKDINDRPSMNKVVEIMSTLFKYFPGSEEPIIYNDEETYESSGEEDDTDNAVWGFSDSCMERNSGVSNSCLSGQKVFLQQSSPLKIDIGSATGEAWECVSSSDEPDYNALNGETKVTPENSRPTENRDEEFDKIYMMLDPQLRPLEPDRTCEQSVKIFEEHKQIATEYLKVQTELAYTAKRKEELAEKLSQVESLSSDADAEYEEIRKLENEKASLLQFYNTLKKQLEIIQNKKNQQQQQQWINVVHHSETHPTT